MLSDRQLPAALRQKIHAELAPGEFIRWMEQPTARPYTLATISLLLLSGLPGLLIFSYIADTWTSLPAADPELPHQALGQFKQIGRFVVGGLGLLLSCVQTAVPWLQWHIQRQTVYLITNRRVLILKGSCSTQVRCFEPHQLQDLCRRERSDGKGDIILTTRHRTDCSGNDLSRDGRSRDGRTEDIGLLNIRNPRAVERLLKDWDAAGPRG